MKEERSFVYTLILGICMLVSLLLIGRMLLGHPEAQAEIQVEPESPNDKEGQQIHLSENDLCTLIVQALPFSPDGITIKIGQDATVSLSASVKKQTLLDADLIPGNMRTALLFLPDNCKIYGVWEVAIGENMLNLQCATIEVGGFALPDAISSKITEHIANSLNKQLVDWGIYPTKISFEEGGLLIGSTSTD